MATFHQRNSGWWQAKIRRIGYPSQSKSFEYKKDAEAWARDIESKIDKGSLITTSVSEKTNMSQLIARFKADFATKNYRKRDDGKEAWKFQCEHLNKFFGKYSLAAVTPQAVAKYRDERNSLVSDSTVRKELYMLSKIFSVTEKEFEVALPNGNPVAKVRKPKEGRGRNRRITDDEFVQLMIECTASRNKWLAFAVQLGVETTLRQADLLNLEWVKISFDQKLAFLNEPGKTDEKDPRKIPLSGSAIQLLRNMPKHESGKVIPLQRMTLYHAFVAAVKRAGIEDYDWHDLRHEGLSRLGNRGDISVHELAAMSGHQTLQLLKKYVHVREKELAEKLS